MIAILYDKDNNHHSYRLVNGLLSCGLQVEILHEPNNNKYDYIFVESSYPKEIKLDSYSNIFLYDVEDDPDQNDTGPAYHQLKDKVIAYVKYNYRKSHLDGMKLIACPLSDYIIRGRNVANAVKTFNRTMESHVDAFFIGGPSYYSLGYTAPSSANHICTNDLNTVPIDIWNKNSLKRVYHQRLEWVAKIKSNKNLRFAGGLWFRDENNISLEFQKRQFGRDIEKYIVQQVDHNTLYSWLLFSKFGLCPSGFARSSFRLIELMALGKPIILTNDAKYKYLYNPTGHIQVEDGCDIDQILLELKDDKEFILDKSIENHILFRELTPEKMFKDFLTQI